MAILACFDNPQEKMKIIHIAGTNGKGSVSSILSEILRADGSKTGLFTSPHITKYNERIKINGEEISDEKFLNLIGEINEKAFAQDIYLTEFEILTAAAYIHFEREDVEFAVMEVGLGGRFDATNVIKSPFLTIITSISIDHTERLGDTIEKIAFEKAGIIKQGVECVVAATNKGLSVIREIAKEKKAPIILAQNSVKVFDKKNTHFALVEGEEYEFALRGDYQAENLSLILAAIWILRRKGVFITEEAFAEGLKNARHAGRFEYFKKCNLIIDGAHNPDGAMVLRESLEKMFGVIPFTFVYAALNTKDYDTILKTLVKPQDELFLYDFKRENAVSTETLKSHFKNAERLNIGEFKKLVTKRQNASNPVVFTGSLYAIGEIYEKISKLAVLD